MMLGGTLDLHNGMKNTGNLNLVDKYKTLSHYSELAFMTTLLWLGLKTSQKSGIGGGAPPL